jgi:ligand-binding SRPBCC domain-containing protein
VNVRIVDRAVVVPAPAKDVWDRVVTPQGINDEIGPWMTMSIPREAEDVTVENITVGEPVGRAWLRLFGLVPFDYDDLTIAELDPGRRFHEKSTMLSMRRWEHERTLTGLGDATEVRDRITLEPRLPVPGLALLLSRLVHAFFGHRHRRLRKHFRPAA